MLRGNVLGGKCPGEEMSRGEMSRGGDVLHPFRVRTPRRGSVMVRNAGLVPVFS